MNDPAHQTGVGDEDAGPGVNAIRELLNEIFKLCTQPLSVEHKTDLGPAGERLSDSLAKLTSQIVELKVEEAERALMLAKRRELFDRRAAIQAQYHQDISLLEFFDACWSDELLARAVECVESLETNLQRFRDAVSQSGFVTNNPRHFKLVKDALESEPGEWASGIFACLYHCMTSSEYSDEWKSRAVDVRKIGQVAFILMLQTRDSVFVEENLDLDFQQPGALLLQRILLSFPGPKGWKYIIPSAETYGPYGALSQGIGASLL
jgi:hypothetical protein